MKWTAHAEHQLTQLYAYIAKDSVFYARHIVNSLIDRSVLLEEFPASGRVVPELGDETVRERLVYSYRLICQIRDNDIQVLALIHQRQHLDADDIPRSQ